MNRNIFATNFDLLVPLSWQPNVRYLNSVRSNNLILKYQRFTPSGCKDLKIRKLKFVTKTQFLCICDMNRPEKPSLKQNCKIKIPRLIKMEFLFILINIKFMFNNLK